MKVSVLITNCNYGAYVCEAVDSVLSQTYRVHEVIVVDDGSTDDSRDVLSARYGGNDQVVLLFKENTGQIGAYNAGYSVFEGDVLFFLDADDTFEPCHVEDAISVYRSMPEVEFITTGYRRFGESTDEVLKYSESRNEGYSAIGAYYGLRVVGEAPGSTASIRRSLAKRILPYEAEWSFFTRGHGDLPLVLGSSVMQARKYYIAKANVNYRQHFDSHSYVYHSLKGNQFLEDYLRNAIVHCYAKKAGLHSRTINSLMYEFNSIDKPSREEMKLYSRLAWKTYYSLFKQLKLWMKVRRRYRRANNISWLRMPV